MLSAQEKASASNHRGYYAPHQYSAPAGYLRFHFTLSPLQHAELSRTTSSWAYVHKIVSKWIATKEVASSNKTTWNIFFHTASITKHYICWELLYIFNERTFLKQSEKNACKNTSLTSLNNCNCKVSLYVYKLNEQSTSNFCSMFLNHY